MNKSLVTNLVSITLIIIGYLTPVFSEEIKSMGLYSFSGAITNWLAIHMLFEKIPYLYGSGIITERFQEFKVGIRSLVMNQFFTQENFEKFMSQNSENLIKIDKEAIFESINFDHVFTKLKSAIMESPFGSMLGMFGGEEALEPLKPKFEEKFKETISNLLSDDKFLKSLAGKSGGENPLMKNVQAIVDQRLEELTPKMVKDIIQDMIKVHLGWLVVWGGVFGALIGLIVTLIN